MSQQCKNDNLFDSISRIETLLAHHAENANSNGNTIPANELMECLKLPRTRGDKNSYTELGDLIQNSLATKPDIECIRWIVFHFDFPKPFFEEDSRATRNWIAIHKKEQELLDAVHEETIQTNPESIRNIYAPSIIASILRTRRIEDIRVSKSRWWIYRLESIEKSKHIGQHEQCCNILKGDTDFICFSPEQEHKRVLVSTCKDDFGKGRKTITLGEFLRDEDEETSYNRFERFAQLIRHRSSNEKNLNKKKQLPPEITIKCNFYVRIPVFFACGTEQFMTEIYIAVHHKRNDITAVSKLIKSIVPALRLCVSLVNSHVGYSMAAQMQKIDMAALLHAVLRHDLKNLSDIVDGRVGLLLEDWDESFKDKDLLKDSFLFIRSNTMLSKMSTALDVLWKTPNLAHSMQMLLHDLKDELDKSWYGGNVKSCEFTGDWGQPDIKVPRISRIILSNLLRNALSQPTNKRIRFDVKIYNKKTVFKCYSEKTVKDDAKEKFFNNPLPLATPSKNRGVWISRHIAERLLKGKLILEQNEKPFGTIIRFEFPMKM